jgi:DNA polymerase III subunit epsilon
MDQHALNKGHFMTKTTVEQYAVLDFEASSLSLDSWPIEVGISWIEQGKVQTWSSLIYPAPEWDLLDWSIQSAAVHKISFAHLRGAPVAAEIAPEVIKQIHGKTLVSDAPNHEQHWLSKLLETDPTCDVPTVANFDSVSAALFDGYALDMLYEALERTTAPHRAGPDSARLTKAWLKAKEIDAELKGGKTDRKN